KTTNGFMIDLYTTKLAKGVYLSTPVTGNFSDNYFDLMPFEEKQIQFFTEEGPDNFQDSIKVISLIDSYSK
ncbi:MAG: hypothetical protein HQ542_00585, partial [Bacteroidia bacterium]|nr:hypothetical protein [Bacteroidia bacterium]